MNACRNRPFHHAVGATRRRVRNRTAACRDTARRAPCRRTPSRHTPSGEADFERTVAALESEAVRRALSGVAVPVFHQGRECGSTVKHSDQLLMFLLKTLKPGRYAGGKNAAPAAPAEPERTFALEIDLAAAGDAPALEEPTEGESESEGGGEIESESGGEIESESGGEGEGEDEKAKQEEVKNAEEDDSQAASAKGGQKELPASVRTASRFRRGARRAYAAPASSVSPPAALGRSRGLPGLAVPVQRKRRQKGQGWRQRGEAVGQGSFGPAQGEPRQTVLAQRAVRRFEEAIRAVDGPTAGGATMSDHTTSRLGCRACAVHALRVPCRKSYRRMIGETDGGK